MSDDNDDGPAPIPEFAHEPIKLWRHDGIDCAIYLGPMAPCGYVRIPDGNPLRAIGEAADVVYRAQERSEVFQRWIDTVPEGRLGYNGLDDILDAPGDLNWGPSPQGWVGFDTAHAFDVWKIEDLRQWIPEGTPERAHFEMLVSHGLHTSQIMARHRVGYEQDWTLEKLVRAVEHLAHQVATVKVEK